MVSVLKFRRLRSALMLSALVGLPALAPSGPAAPADPARSCFFVSDWTGGWHAPSPEVIYLRIKRHEVWRVDLSTRAPELQWADRSLVTTVNGGNTICSALDLNLSVTDGSGFRTPLIIKALTKLTPDEVAALPAKDRP